MLHKFLVSSVHVREHLRKIDLSRVKKMTILISLFSQLSATQISHANPYYEAGCRNAVSERNPGRFKQETVSEFCRCQSRNRGKDQDVCAAILEKDANPQRFSNSEEFTIGVMTVAICAKRLDRLSSQGASEMLLEVLSEQNLPLVLGTRQDLWKEAYKEVGGGIEWCIKNQ